MKLRTFAATASMVVLASVINDAQGPAGTVTIARPEYDRMLDLAMRRPVEPEPPPVGAALTRTDIRARVTAGLVRATVQIEGEVFRTGTVKVPLLTGATLTDARMDGRPVPLVAEGGRHFAILAGPSTFTVTLEWVAPVTISPGRGSFMLPVPASGSVTATIDVPGEQSDVRIQPGLVIRRGSDAGQTRIEATLDPGSPGQVSWSTRETAPATVREARTLSAMKTLVTIGDADLRLVTLVDLTVVQGEPAEFDVRIPAGYEVVSVTGASLDRTEERPEHVVLFVRNAAQRRHQFLIDLERPHGGGSLRLETGFPTLPSAERETGEVAVEGAGTMNVASPDTPGLRRFDVREIDPALATAARHALLSAYRYQRTPGAGSGPAADALPALTLDVTRFADAPVLAAIADRAVATTLVTGEGRALTEVTLWVRNRAQSFVKVELPAGASMVSAEVAGEPVKPVEGKDGTRVPLLRQGFRSGGEYVVSYVYLHAGAPFLKKGERQVTLPRMDLPVNLVEWELFVPDRYRADRFDGNVIAVDTVEESASLLSRIGLGAAAKKVPVAAAPSVAPGQIVGRVTDASGAPIPGVTVAVAGSGTSQSAITDGNGVYVLTGVPTGRVTVTGSLTGFKSAQRSFAFDQRPRQADLTLEIGAVSETVTVSADAPVIDTRSSTTGVTIRMDEDRPQSASNPAQQSQTPSANVQSLQRRAAGVLPVRIDVPRAGTSHRFVRPLVVDEETMVSFRYRSLK